MPARPGMQFSFWHGLRELPKLDRDRQSTVPGVYVVGDLADAPIIKGALQQGWDTGHHLADTLQAPSAHDYDVVIVGGGPAGMAMALALEARGMRYVVLERTSTFHTIAAFPKGKKIYADPRDVPTPPGWWFEDAPAEALVARWHEDLADEDLHVLTGRSVTAIEGSFGQFRVRAGAETFKGRRVVIAIGRRGTPRTLGVPGDDLPHVHHDLLDSDDHRGEDVAIVGGGDSAVEAALLLAEAGARPTLVYRKAKLNRPKKKNRVALEQAVRDGRVTLRTETHVRGVESDTLIVEHEGTTEQLPATTVYAMIGTQLPRKFLDSVGIRIASDPRVQLRRLPWVFGFAALVWCFYLLKHGKAWFPFHEGSPLASVPELLTVTVHAWPTVAGPRVLTPGFFGTLVYSATIVLFGLLAMRRHNDRTQRRRYLSLMGFQCVFLFGIPELLAPLVTATPSKAYSLSVPWPLSLYSIAHEPAAWTWMILGALVSFVAIPLFVWRFNEAFCSYLCGCGGMAETLGDTWRWRAPRGDGAKRAEWSGRLILLLAIPVTLAIIADSWNLVAPDLWLEQQVEVRQDQVRIEAPTSEERPGAIRVASAEVDGDQLVVVLEKLEHDGTWQPTGWMNHAEVGDAVVYGTSTGNGTYALPLASLDGPATLRAASSKLSDARSFAAGWYALMVDFWLASVLGVVLYPLIGNRFWCRFFCPLRAYMELLSRAFGRLAIRANDKCITCGECTKACQMGIDVQGFASQGLHFDNSNSACIQCGVCVEVCPVDCLSLVDKKEAGLNKGRTDVIGPRWGV